MLMKSALYFCNKLFNYKTCTSVWNKKCLMRYNCFNISTTCVDKNKDIFATESDILTTELLEDYQYNELIKSTPVLKLAELKRKQIMNVVVLQPWVKWGPSKRTETTSNLLLDEACALVNTLPDFFIIHKEVVPIKYANTHKIFGVGTIARLKEVIKKNKSVSAIFISVNQLKKGQLKDLEDIFKVSVFDRYLIVLAIFHSHAKTKEAKLQIAIAELPLVRRWVTVARDSTYLDDRDRKLKLALNRLSEHRKRLRTHRTRSNIPTVSVVGYTNSGKTTLIKALTGDEKMEGCDQLFATLDVTAHDGRLPCGLKVIYIDTVGFIQDIPTNLIASFKATLEDAVLADIIIHIRDISHPDYNLQGAVVLKTLQSLPVSSSTPIIEVNSKADKVSSKLKINEECDELLVSAVNGLGLQNLLSKIEEKIIEVTERQSYTFYLPTGSAAISWLRKNSGLVDELIDENNPQRTRIVAIMSIQEVASFRKIIKSIL